MATPRVRVEVGPAGGVMAPAAQSRLRVLLGLLGVVDGRLVTAEALVDGLCGSLLGALPAGHLTRS